MSAEYNLNTSCLSSCPSSLKTLLVQDPQWAAPRLLQLPDNYNIIFQYYHRKTCTACKKVPKDPALCLVCGAFVCLKGVCCKQQGICECVLVSFSMSQRHDRIIRSQIQSDCQLSVCKLDTLSDFIHPLIDMAKRLHCLSLAALPALWRSYRHLSTDKCLCHHHHPRTSLLPLGFCLPRCPRRGGPRFTVRQITCI